MALETRLEVKLSQKLILTPQLQQAIKLLQMPQLELSQAINQELVENPFLEELTDEQPEVSMEDSHGDAEKPDNSNGDIEGDVEMSDSISTYAVDDYFDERGSDGRDLGYFSSGYTEKPGFETFLTTTTGLTEHLKWQLDMTNASEDIKEAAEMIIGNIDENGYLQATTEELVKVLGLSEEIVTKAIALVQRFDPMGICARNIKECLLIQVKALKLKGTLVEAIVQNNLEDIEKNRPAAIAKQYNAALEDVHTAIHIIEGFEPKPGRKFSSVQVSYVVPDVYIDKVDDEYRIFLNDDSVPRLRISSMYKELLTQKNTFDKTDKQFLLDKYKSAMWLLRSLDERNKTIYRVTESIMKYQMDFFEKGVEYLRPLSLRIISEEIGIHESNISRVTSNKYISCAHGMFPLKYFFSSSLTGDEGSVSSTSVKDLIKTIVDEEDSSNPLTDQKIVEICKSKNINIARRTLAKYREELKIPPHTKRKKQQL
ncbi:RNA polymerase factor sigma-54 [Candidatus Magnetominusculus xianensis]|uniref:RNA polymerase sigma-54 factor n=1 Tax=Candidatus Magnetominusculus xianensis TaxID=1748249 RepID=A0ABR5SAX5_9BACT|nr:RNA polymerase factor sigma-54 [Candidatus Magnetominusculus xianensis]KWT75018.1 RNA polymerase sigma-54 factor [Candidatus Magnetominusculus xianensis]MBF0405632.1 RNA polymerase factor sigma-54 [Nitrospirota bacterium]